MPSSPKLNLNIGEIERAGRLLTEFLSRYEKSIPVPYVLPPINRTELSELLQQPFPEKGIGIDQLFQIISDKVVPNSTAIAHPRFLAYVLGPPNGIAPFAEAIASTLNQNCNFWQLSPAANVIEQKVISWLFGLFQYPRTSGGIITSGGSMASLIALSTAIHDKCSIDFREKGLQSLKSPLVLYISEEAHRCVEKDAVILGLGLDNVRKIPADSAFQMSMSHLGKAVQEDRKAGKQPFCVVASAGTINTGAIDPIDALADFCNGEDLWLHVDGAYGGLFILSQKIRDQLLPCGRADSIAIDPHKLLFAPLEAGCLIVRDRAKLGKAFSYSASYLTAEQDPLLINYMDYGPQLSRSFKAFKIWCALQVFGVNAFTESTEHMLEIARYLEERIRRDKSSFELLAPVTLNAVCFRLKNMDASGNQRILAQLIDEGTALLGPVLIGGKFGIRTCITNYRTTKEDIDCIMDRLLEFEAMFDPA